MRKGITTQVLTTAKFHQTVADIVRETGAKPNTVRVVLRRAATKGLIHLEKFYAGRGALRVRAICHDEGLEDRLNMLVCNLCGKSTVEDC